MSLRLDVEKERIKCMSISKVAKLLAIETSTIRFWESQNLLTLRRNSQNYRIFDRKALKKLLEIAHFRRIQMPIPKVQEHLSSSYIEKKIILSQSKKYIDEQIKTLLHTRQLLEQRIERIDEIAFLNIENGDELKNKPDLSQLVKFDIYNQMHVEQYLEDPSNYVLYFPDCESEILIEGILLNDGEKKTRKISHFKNLVASTTKKSGVVKINCEKSKKEFLIFKKRIVSDIDANVLIAQFLETSAEAEGKYDYYKYWVV